MLDFVGYQPTVLYEVLRLDGLQDHTSPPPCSSCLDEPGLCRCQDCSIIPLYCVGCIVSRHSELPLHRIEVCLHALRLFLCLMFAQMWSGGFYQRKSLRELGLSFYLGHGHTPCPSADSAFQKILVIDNHGAHCVKVQFCACKGAPGWVEHYRQLLRMQWYPASFQRPRTTFTFDLLDEYHKLTLQGKLNLYDFYTSVMQRYDHCGRKKVIVSDPTFVTYPLCNPTPFQHRYHEISRCVRQWRTIMQAKRGGGGHSPPGLASPPGGFALECPACPQPGRNLPEGWEDAPDDKKYAVLSLSLRES